MSPEMLDSMVKKGRSPELNQYSSLDAKDWWISVG